MKNWLTVARWVWLSVRLVLAIVQEWKRVERESPKVSQSRPAIKMKVTEAKKRRFDAAVSERVEQALGVRPTAEQVAEVRAKVDDLLNPKSRWRRPNAGKPLGSKP